MAFNGMKLLREAGKYYGAWFDGSPANHAGGDWTNRYVEAMRASPYWGGHVDQIVHPLCLVLILLLWWRW